MLPPKGDPHRRRVVAGRMLFLLGLSHCVPIIFAIAMDGGGFVIIAFLLCGVPIITYVVLGLLLKARRFWSLIAAIAIASLESLIPLTVTVGLIVNASPDDSSWLNACWVCGIIDVLLITTLVLLVRCFAAFREDRIRNTTGFTPIMPLAVIPIEEPQSRAVPDPNSRYPANIPD